MRDTVLGRLLILLMTPLPRHLLSSMAGWVARLSVPVFLRPWVYRLYCWVFGADASQAEHGFTHYPTLNAWFTRSLKPGLRPLATGVLACPCDGAAGASGSIEQGVLLQAKGHTYSLSALLGGDDRLVTELDGGTFATLYLSPRDYHRFHVPVTSEVVGCTYIPGHLWPVNNAAVAHVPGLFSVNERLVIELRRPQGGLVVVVAVGATMVGMTRVVFDDLHTNARRGVVDQRRYQPGKRLEAGEQLGHFEFGSTLVVCCSARCGRLTPPPLGAPLRMGQALGSLSD